MTKKTERRGNGLKDMTGQVIGKLTVLDYAGTDEVQRAAVWLCRCECGQEVQIRGTALRKGDRKSCGCADPQHGRRRRGAVASPVARRNRSLGVVERHGLMALVRSLFGDEALVEFDKACKSWVCSECGPNAKCGHIDVATRDLSLEAVREVASVVAPRKAGTLSSKAGGAAEGQTANDKARVVALAKTSIERAERVAQHDRKHEQIVGEVTVRQMTDEERARLAERRAKKSRAFAY